MVNICSQTWRQTSMTQHCGTFGLSVSWHSSHIESIFRPQYNWTKWVHVSPWDLNTTVYICLLFFFCFKSIPRRKCNILYINQKTYLQLMCCFYYILSVYRIRGCRPGHTQLPVPMYYLPTGHTCTQRILSTGRIRPQYNTRNPQKGLDKYTVLRYSE